MNLSQSNFEHLKEAVRARGFQLSVFNGCIKINQKIFSFKNGLEEMRSITKKFNVRCDLHLREVIL